MRHELVASLIAAALALPLLLSPGCANLTLREKYDQMSREEQNSFLADYPDFHPGDSLHVLDRAARNRISGSGMRRSRSAIAPSHYSLKGLRIDAKPAGEGYALNAFVTWEDGRIANVTTDADWSVPPRLASISERQILDFGCISSDIEVHADFLGEAAESRTFAVRKKIRALRLEPAGSATSVDEAGFYRFQVIAECEDGSKTDVSCLADWEIEDPHFERRGCGLVRVESIGAPGSSRGVQRRLASQELSGVSIPVRAAYGGLEVRAAFHIPFQR